MSDDAEDGGVDRKQWIEDRLQMLAENFAVSVGGFAVMDKHLHVLCRYVTPQTKLLGQEQDVFTSRDRKLEHAREQRRKRRQQSQAA